jgi:ribosome-associated toxin RatA of RatAB toxin-antitoxin module
VPGRILATALAACSCAAALTAAESHPTEFLRFPDAEKTLLRAGKTVTWCQPLADPRKTAVHCAILLPMRPADVWALIDDKESACDYLDDVQSCKVLRKEGNQELIEQTTKPAGSPKAFTYRLRHESSPPERMDFRRESGDLRHIEGSWIFDPVDGGTQTLLIYGLHIDPGPLLPQKIVNRSQQKRLPEVLLAIRERLSSQQKLGLCCTVPGAEEPAGPPAP